MTETSLTPEGPSGPGTWSLAVVAASGHRALREELASDLADLGPVTPGEERDGVVGAADATCVVFIVDPELLMAGWTWGPGACLTGRSIGIAGDPSHPRGFPGVPVLRDRALLKRWIGAVRDGGEIPELPSVIEPEPAYPSPGLRASGERLSALFLLRDRDPERWGGELAEARAAHPRLQPGAFLGDGRWRLLQRQAGTTWAAWDRLAADRVSIEVGSAPFLGDDAASPGSRGGVAEGGALALPGVLPILHAGRDGDVAFAVRPWRQHSLRDVVLAPAAAVELALEVGTALDSMHAAGVIHGRLDPEAVWLAEDGTASIAAFGPPSEPRRSLYSPPESLEPDWTPTPAGDVYALGMILLRAIHGADLPFWVLREPERLIASLPVPAAVRDVARRAVEWDLERRLESAAALGNALLADRHVVAVLAEAAEKSGRADVATAHLRRLLAGADADLACELNTRLGALEARSGRSDAAIAHLKAAISAAADPEPVLAELRSLPAVAANPAILAAVLADEAERRPPELAARLRAELARLQHASEPSVAAANWVRVLEQHRSPGQAREALSALVALTRAAGEWESFISFGRDLLPYLPQNERPPLQYAIGSAYLVGLGDEQNALQWLDRAEAGGFSSIELARQLEEIRARRGQWGHAIALMRRQAEVQSSPEAAATLLRAASLARSVQLGDQVGELYEAVLAQDPGDVDALRVLARRDARFGRLADAVARGRQLVAAGGTAADRADLARWLDAAGEPEAALDEVRAAHLADARHVGAAALLASLAFERGDRATARAAWTGLCAAFEGAVATAMLIEAKVGLAELSWLDGDLVDAHRRFNEVVELDHDALPGWWGLAKVALVAHGADGTPWIEALPERFTPFEALARLLMGVLDSDALGEWAVGWSGRLPDRGSDRGRVRLACGAVDLLFHADAVPELLRRLATAYPEWSRAIGAVQDLWSDPARHADVFPVQRSYRWSGAWVEDAEPGRDRARTVTSAAPVPQRRNQARPGRDLRWSTLLSGNRPPSPDSEALTPDPPTEVFAGPSRIPALLFAAGGLAVVMPSGAEEVLIGSDPGSDLVVAGAHPRHARMVRAGPYAYVEAVGDAAVKVNGARIQVLRLLGGETVEIGDLATVFQWYEREEELPELGRPPPRTFPPEPPGDPRTLPPLPPMILEPSDALTDPAARQRPIAGILSASSSETPVGATLRLFDDNPGGEFDELPAHALPPMRVDKPSWANDGPTATPVGTRVGTPLRPIPRVIEPVAPPVAMASRPAVPASVPPAAPARSLGGETRIRGAVEVMSGPERGYTRFVHDELSIGRGKESNIHIASDTQLSRIHCKVVARGGGYTLVDNGSTRGTVVNGRKISEVELRGGEVIMAGRTVFSFKLVEDGPDRSDDATEMVGEGS